MIASGGTLPSTASADQGRMLSFQARYTADLAFVVPDGRRTAVQEPAGLTQLQMHEGWVLVLRQSGLHRVSQAAVIQEIVSRR